MAPEYVVHGHLTEKADVYSFGMLILEIVTGKKCSNAIGPRTGQSLLSKVICFIRGNGTCMHCLLASYEVS